MLTLTVNGPHWTKPEFSNGADEEKRSCFGGWALGGLRVVLTPQAARRIKGILVRDMYLITLIAYGTTISRGVTVTLSLEALFSARG